MCLDIFNKDTYFSSVLTTWKPDLFIVQKQCSKTRTNGILRANMHFTYLILISWSVDQVFWQRIIRITFFFPAMYRNCPFYLPRSDKGFAFVLAKCFSSVVWSLFTAGGLVFWLQLKCTQMKPRQNIAETTLLSSLLVDPINKQTN